MGDQRRPLQPGEPAPAFALPAANREGMVSLDSLRGRPFLIGFFRGLHCPFCRRQVLLLARQPDRRVAGAGASDGSHLRSPCQRRLRA